jgi:hypothetical protein
MKCHVELANSSLKTNFWLQEEGKESIESGGIKQDETEMQ